MLFSRVDVADGVNRAFEPAWEMVRPVPTIRIDFGDGKVVTRTLHGNIATHVCTPLGAIADVLPGLYTPAIYMAALEQIAVVAVEAHRAAPAERVALLRQYHRNAAARLRPTPPRIAYPRGVVFPRPAPAPTAAAAAPPDRAKHAVELRVEQIVIGPPPAAAPRGDGLLGPRVPPGTNLADWAPLAADTWRNETERRLLIHERLAAVGRVHPVQLKKWLYKDVLHADLTDPYLGLGDALLGDDVFREVEA